MADGEQHLWETGIEALEPRKGPLFDQHEQTKILLARAKKAKLLKKDQRTNWLYTDEYSQIPFIEDGPQVKTIEAHQEPHTDALLLAVTVRSPEGSKKYHDDTTRYQINSDGTLVDRDTNEPVDAHDAAFTHVTNGLELLHKHLEQDIDSVEYSRDERRRTIRSIGFGALTAGVVSTAIIFGIKIGILDPAEAYDQYRNTYDEGSHALPGEGYTLDSHDFEILPDIEFSAIPDYGGSDRDVLQPRTMKLDAKTGCGSLTTEFAEGSLLSIALPESSTFASFHYTTSLESNGFTICIAEQVPDGGFDGDIEIAVQQK